MWGQGDNFPQINEKNGLCGPTKIRDYVPLGPHLVHVKVIKIYLDSTEGVRIQ